MNLRHVYFTTDVAISTDDRVSMLSIEGDPWYAGLGFTGIVRNDDGVLVCSKPGHPTISIVGHPYTCVLAEGQEQLPIKAVVVPGGCTTRIDGDTLYVVPTLHDAKGQGQEQRLTAATLQPAKVLPELDDEAGAAVATGALSAAADGSVDAGSTPARPSKWRDLPKNQGRKR